MVRVKPQMTAAPRARSKAWLPAPSDQCVQRRSRSSRLRREAWLTPRRSHSGTRESEGELDAWQTRPIREAAILVCEDHPEPPGEHDGFRYDGNPFDSYVRSAKPITNLT